MASRLERVTLLPDDSDDERPASSRRQDYYTSQRTSRSDPRPSTSASHGTSKSRDKRAAYQPSEYQEPQGFENLDEQAVPPPIANPDDEPYYRRQSGLEQNIQEQRPGSRQPAVEGYQPKKSSERPQSARRRRNIPQGEDDLGEVAAPAPIQKRGDDDRPGTIEREHYLEDEERGESDGEGASPPTHQQRNPEDFLAEEPQVPKLLTQLYTISYLIFFAIIGTLARLGTQWITFYPGTPIVTPVIWANFGGSLIMGFLAEDQGLFRPNPNSRITNGEKPRGGGAQEGEDFAAMAKDAATKRKKAIPLYIGLATGFCGSYTSFSSFARDFFLALSNNLPTPYNHPPDGVNTPDTSSTVSRNGGYSFEAFIHVVIATLALSLGGLIVGAQIAVFLDPVMPKLHGSFIRRFVDPAMVVVGFGCWLGCVFLAIFPPDRPGGPVSNGSWMNETWRGEVLFALVFAPPGCLLRWLTSMKLNGLVPAFPLGTFAVNMFGTAIEGMCYDLQHVGVGIMGGVGGGTVGCQVLQGIMDGFCGCLTTVSTWVAEINGLKRMHAWGYAFGSVAGGFCLMVVIMGSVRWSTGYIEPICNTGYTSKIHG